MRLRASASQRRPPCRAIRVQAIHRLKRRRSRRFKLSMSVCHIDPMIISMQRRAAPMRPHQTKPHPQPKQEGLECASHKPIPRPAVHRGFLTLIWTVWNHLKHVLFGRCKSGAAKRSWQAPFPKHHPMQHQRQLTDLAVQFVSLRSHLNFLPFSRSDAPSFVKSHNRDLGHFKRMLRIIWNLLKLTPFKTSGWSWTADLHINFRPYLSTGLYLLCCDVLSCGYRHITYFVIVNSSCLVLK